MMRLISEAILALLLSVATAQPLPLIAQQLSAEENAAAQVQRSTGGQVLAVRATTQSGRAGFLVKVLLPDGRVRNVFVPK